MSGKEFYSLLRTSGGLALEYQDLIESDFASANGSAYTPPEEGTFRRINVSRSIQLLGDCPGIIETFQTSTCEVRLPSSTIAYSTDDSGNGRLFWLKNSGVGNVVVKDYLGTTLFTLYNGIHIIVTGNKNNNWDFYFTASNIFFDPTGTPYTSTNIRDVILEINSSIDTSASPPFSFSRAGANPPGTYLLHNAVPSNKSGCVIPVSGFIEDIYITVEDAGTYTFSIERRVGIVFTEIVQVTLSATRKDIFDVNIAVSRGDELVARVRSTSSGSPQNVNLGLIVKGSLV